MITGASGMIGSCIIDVLVEANRSYNKDFIIYALSQNKDILSRRFASYENVICVAQSVVEPIKINNIEYIIHAASPADPRKYAIYPVETILTNVLGTKNVLDYCRSNNSRALLLSSFEVYGKSASEVFSEDQYGIIDLSRIRSCYPESKRLAELLVSSYADEYGVDCLSCRLPSVYGPTMKEDDSKAHAQFLRCAISKNNIVMKSEGKQRRTYCYVMDAVSGILTLLSKGVKGEVYNISNEQSVSSIAELAEMIAEIAGTKVEYSIPSEIEKKGFSDPQNCILDNSKLKTLGWNGEYGLYEGIKETIDILRETNAR